MIKEDKCLYFADTGDVIDYMMDIAEKVGNVALVSNYDNIMKIFKEIISDYAPVTIEIVEIDSYEYDREYVIDLSIEDKDIKLSVCKVYNEDAKRYLASDGIVLIDQDNVHQKYVDDCENNDWVSFVPRYFSIAEEPDGECCDGDKYFVESHTFTMAGSEFVPSVYVSDNHIGWYITKV